MWVRMSRLKSIMLLRTVLHLVGTRYFSTREVNERISFIRNLLYHRPQKSPKASVSVLIKAKVIHFLSATSSSL